MAMAFVEAQKVKGKTLPNPAVGAVLVKAGKVIGKGGTQPAGQAHAEIMAIKKAGPWAKGSTLYVTLEPCNHFGRTPPCVDAIIAAGIRKVCIAIKDANPQVGGKGIRALKKAGLEIELGIMADEAEAWYAGFFFRMLQGRPKIILKIAQTLDGRINGRSGEEIFITGEESRLRVHGLRAEVDAVVIGGQTLRIDDPDLTPRMLKGTVSIPDAIILSRKGPFPAKSKLFAKGRISKTIVLGQSKKGLPPWVDWVDLAKSQPDASAETMVQALLALLNLFNQRGYHSVLVEGGPEIWGLFLSSGLWDTLYLATAPKVLSNGERWDAGLPRDWGNSLKFRNFSAFGKDFWVEFGNSEGQG